MQHMYFIFTQGYPKLADEELYTFSNFDNADIILKKKEAKKNKCCSEISNKRQYSVLF